MLPLYVQIILTRLVLTKVNNEVVPQYLGRRLTLMLVTPASYLLSFVSILFANSVALIFIGR